MTKYRCTQCDSVTHDEMNARRHARLMRHTVTCPDGSTINQFSKRRPARPDEEAGWR